MRFAADEWLWGVAFSLLLAGILALQGVRLTRARRNFAHDERIAELLTAKTGMRRTIQAVLSCLAVALAFVAAAQPQYGKGTRILPATNLDVVIVLDYSKSMYARDVSPSRISRAKVEVGKLIRKLGGARFAAVAFAGENISFPLTSDGSAIAQFFQGMDPNNMPVGGTAIARALESGRQLLDRDPLSKSHERVMILVTDGEDLEGDPVAVAQDVKAAGIRVDVVQIGGQSPEPIPEMDEKGVAHGLRKDESGSLITTQLTAEGEAQLASIAREGGGKLVRAAQGDTGIGEMTNELRRMMTEELSEKVETVFADIYYYPLALAVLLLLIETWVGTSKKRVFSADPPKGHMQKRKPRRMRASAVLMAVSCLGCAKFDALFERESPVVNEAIALLKQKDPDKASKLLIEYLETGPCEAGVIGAGDRARALLDASLDLALSFSALSPKTTAPTGQPPGTPAPGGPGQLPGAQLPGAQVPGAPGAESSAPDQTIDCALRILGVMSGNVEASAELRARAHYVAGNLEMRRGNFEDAVVSYDAGLLYAPGVLEEQLKKGPLAGTVADSLGISIAYNRALALRLKEEKEKQEQEEESQSDQDEQEDSEEQDKKDDSSDEKEQDKKDEQSQDEQGQDDSEKPDEEKEDPAKEDQESSDDSQKGEPTQDEQSQENQGDEQQEQEDQAPEEASEHEQAKSPSEARDQRMLDLLEQAPTLQQHRAEERKKQGVRVRSTMEDK